MNPEISRHYCLLIAFSRFSTACVILFHYTIMYDSPNRHSLFHLINITYLLVGPELSILVCGKSLLQFSLKLALDHWKSQESDYNWHRAFCPDLNVHSSHTILQQSNARINELLQNITSTFSFLQSTNVKEFVHSRLFKK